MVDKDDFKKILNPKKDADRAWYLSLLDEGEQTCYEQNHLAALLQALKALYLAPYQRRIFALKQKTEEIRGRENYSAADYRELLTASKQIDAEYEKMNGYKCFFSEPYFARMDVVDDKEGYNSYYIGKKGDMGLQIVDWRAPFAVRYYQKSRVQFSINEYDYRAVLRRAISVKNGKLVDFKNEYLSVKEVLSPEEIAGRDEEILFDPYLRSIIQSRKHDSHIRDIIQTIQEQQFEIITLPERESFVLQGCAGSGKTMILLHRLSYLMYNNEKLRPRDVLVITPSDSFNAFIDELSQVLELQKVTTTTLASYFFHALKNAGIDLGAKLTGERESAAYLDYVYSPRFPADVKKKIHKLFDGIYGLFAAEECRAVAEQILSDCKRLRERYARIKNASNRVRRAVLGEMKESKEDGFYFTKPFRYLMSTFANVEGFLQYVLYEDVRTPDYFFQRFVEFYRSAKYVNANAEKCFAHAKGDLASLGATVEREIGDLKRYRLRGAAGEGYTYPERILRRQELLKEIASVTEWVEEMGEGVTLARELYCLLRATSACVELGKCRAQVDIARFLYRETVKKYKTKYGLKGVYPSDGYALCRVLTEAGRALTPRYGLVFVDEGQDLSEGEYDLLKRIHADAAFNVFGDLKQNITPWRGVKSWDGLNCNVYTLRQNYRNTNEIVDFVSGVLDVDMKAIGLAGEPVQHIGRKQLGAFFRDKQGLKAVIAAEEQLPYFVKRGFKLLSQGGKLTDEKVYVMSVYESKGLEFSAVAVYDKGMTEHEKYIAYTRALRELAIIED